MSTLSNVPADRIQVEAAALRKLITENRPDFPLVPLDLTGKTSAAIAAFWREIGWSNEFAPMIAPPGPENVKLLDVAIDAYRNWGAPDRLPPLPARFRLVEPGWIWQRPAPGPRNVNAHPGCRGRPQVVPGNRTVVPAP